MTSTLRRHIRAALSRGAGYEAQPLGTRFDGTASAGYFIDFSAKTTTPTSQHPERLPPAGLAQLALGWWERAVGGEHEAFEHFDRVVLQLARRAQRVGDTLIWEYDMPVPKYGISPPWSSAMAQGQAASVFVRAAMRNEAAADIAVRSIRPLVRRTRPLVAITSVGPVLEEAPTVLPSRILNGWIYALWGVWDTANALGLGDAAVLFEASASALRQTIEAYDTGWWSRYSLYANQSDLAKPFYHRLHVDQLEAMYRLTGWGEFRAVSRRWNGYDKMHRASRAVVVKTLEVARR
jgi:hypothetical protein